MATYDALIELAGVDPAVMAANDACQRAVQTGTGGYLPLICDGPLSAEQDAQLPASFVSETFYSDEKTLITGLRGAASMANSGSDATVSMRANLGVGVVPASFGVSYEVFADKMPWVTAHVALDDLDDFDAAAAPLDSVAELAVARSAFLAETLAGSGITPFCFDTQGPFDVAHLVVGDAIFFSLFDDAPRVHRLLDNCVRMIIRLTRLYKEAAGEAPDGGRHGCLAMRGGVRICEDTSTLLNADQIDEFVVPYTRRVLQAFGGGWIHYCGHNDHLYRAVLDMPECYTLNFGNPEKHDLAAVLRDCIEHGKTYSGSVPREPEEDTDAYLRRVVGYTDGAGRGLILHAGYEDGLMDTWHRLQDA